ncbi:MAG: site-specific integrase [Clostridiales bacterium]|jgi:integrase|nr:site-specific integrase [Clostridiales bacterium]
MATKIYNGKYKATVYIGKDGNGKRQYKVFYADNADEADYLALEYKTGRSKRLDKKNITLADAIDQYIDSKSNVLSPTTIRSYKMIRKIRFQSIMGYKILDIDNLVIQRAVNEEAKKLSHKSIKNAYGLLHTVILQYNPYLHLNVTFPQKKAIVYATPDEETLKKIFQVTQGTIIEVPVLLSAWLSLRRSEILGLKWTDIHDTYIEINEARVYADRQEVSKLPKTGASTRKIPLPAYIKEKIDSMPQNGKYIFEGMTGAMIYNTFSRILKNNDLPHCRFHDLRHAFASNLLALNIPTKYAQEMGGWSTDNTLKNVYQQTHSSITENITKQVNEYYISLLPKTE